MYRTVCFFLAFLPILAACRGTVPLRPGYA